MSDYLSSAIKAIKTIKDGLELHQKLPTKICPTVMEDTIVKTLTGSRSDYTKKAGELIQKITTLIKNAEWEYEASSTTISNWCNLAKNLLQNYIRIIDSEAPISSHKVVIVSLLTKGIVKMEAAESDLKKCAKNLKDADIVLNSLHSQLVVDFDSTSDYYKNEVKKLQMNGCAMGMTGMIFGPLGFMVTSSVAAFYVLGTAVPDLSDKFEEWKLFFKNLNAAIVGVHKDIEYAVDQLKHEIAIINSSKGYIEQLEVFVQLEVKEQIELKTILKNSITELIEACDQYIESH